MDPDFYDGFEEEMDNFWNDEDANEEEDYPGEDSEGESDADEEGEFEEDEGFEGDEEIDQILEGEGEEMLREDGLGTALEKGQEVPEKLLLDKLNVDKLVNMLSRVRLAWPEDMPYYNDLEFSTDPERVPFPPSFYHNTDKEKTVMWHAENFRRQYHNQYPRRRPLLIALKNECGCQKLLPTFIAPTVLGYPEFLDCMTTAQYLKDFLSPELILAPPTRVPDRTRSHVTVLKDRKANCWEFALIMVSILNGIGYDSYVVDGYASTSITTMDATQEYIEEEEVVEKVDDMAERLKRMSLARKEKEMKESSVQHLNLEFIDFFQRDEEVQSVRPVSPSKYRFKKFVPVESQHELEMKVRASAMLDLDLLPSRTPSYFGEEEEGTEHEEDLYSHEEGDEEEGEGKEEEEEVKGDEEEEEEEEIELPKIADKPKVKFVPPEKYYKIRNHVWVLVMAGERDVEESFFLEPFSGNRYELTDPNFLGVETVFNQKNFYVNIQPPIDDEVLGLIGISFDLDDPSKWSKLLVEAEKKKKVEPTEEETLFDDDDDDEEPKKYELLLEMPASWTSDLYISQQDYERKYPSGKKSFNYNNAIVELAAPYVNADGLVKKVLKFAGSGRNPEDLEYIEENFSNRKDKLTRRKWIRKGKMLYEYFAKGRKDALKEHVHISGKNRPNHPRNLYYYGNSHPQSVTHREIIKKGVIEHFEDRDDLLYYRFTSYGGVLCEPDRPVEDEEDEHISHSKAKELLEILKGDTGGHGGKKRVRRKVIQIAEKYMRDLTKDYRDDIAEKFMFIDEGRLRIVFNYGEGNLTRNSLEFFKPRGVNVATTDFKPEDCIEYQADRDAPPMDVYKKFKLLQRMEEDQRVASVLAVQAEDEVFQTVTSRVQEDWRHILDQDVFSGDMSEEFLKKEKLPDDEDYEEDDFTGMDFTTPFFEKFGVPRNKHDEILMKKRIMLNAKVKLIKKAHAIMETFEREASRLKQKLVWYDKHIEKMTGSQEEDYNHMYRDRLFQMHIMELRITRHKELTPRTYYNLLIRVLKHPMLNRFSNKKIPPPKPAVSEMTEEEKARLAAELAKLKDCCQFYTLKHEEFKKVQGTIVTSPNPDEGAVAGENEKPASPLPDPPTEQEVPEPVT